ncbi:MAG: glycosyltransferase family 39 protein [Acidobacteriota bacterium]
MRTIADLEVSYAQIDQPKIEPRLGLFDKLERRKLVVIIVTVAIGFCARAYRVDAAGFAEDEANKIFAVRAYEQGDFTANAEHPMVMKMLCYASMHTAAVWNTAAGQKLDLVMSEETALRLPNVALGALTVIPLLLLTAGLLGFRVGFITALLWALGLDAIWFSRTAKEDTLLVFFMFWGFYLYYKAKQAPASDVSGQERLYSLAGAAFGLMMASKYFPHFFALNALFYTLVGYDSRNNRPLTRAMWRKYFAALVLAFAMFNPAAFFPQTWRYLWKYVNEEWRTHHGYLIMDKLFINDLLQTPGGNPWYFYFLFLGVKLPLPVLLAFAVGLVEIYRRRGSYPLSRGYLFLRMNLLLWLIPEALVGTKFLRYSLSLLPLIYMTAAVGIVLMWRALSAVISNVAASRHITRATAAVALTVIFIIAPAALTIKCLLYSYPSLYVNVFGRNRIGYFFPHDEFYDLGARESIRFIAETAPPGAMMASEIPGVVQYYLERFNRTDIRSQIISQTSFTTKGRPDFVLLQPGRVYFENSEHFKFIEKTFPIVQSSVYEGAAATRVYSTGNR